MSCQEAAEASVFLGLRAVVHIGRRTSEFYVHAIYVHMQCCLILSPQEAAEVSVVLGAFKLLMTIVAVLTVDKVRGRRTHSLPALGLT